MFLARKSKLVLSAAALSVLGGLVGCMQRRANSGQDETVAPVVADEAMQKRDWAQSSAIYPNGGVAAGPTNFLYEPRRDMPEYRYTVDDSAIFLVNMALFPYEIITHPPNTIEVSQGETYPRTYTAMPLLPPSENPGPEIESLPTPASPVIESPAAKSRVTSLPASQSVTPSVAPSRSTTTSPGGRPSSPVIDSLPTAPGAQPTGSPLVTPGRGQPQAPPITLPPASPSSSPNHPASKPLAPTSSGTSSGASSSAAPAPIIHAPTTRASNSTNLESPSAVDLSLAPPISNSQSTNSQATGSQTSSASGSVTSSASSSNSSSTETRIVGGKLTVVPSTQPTTNPVNWPPLNK